MKKLSQCNSLPSAAWLKDKLPSYIWPEPQRPGKILHIALLYSRATTKLSTVSYEIELQSPTGEGFRQTYAGYIWPGERLWEEYHGLLNNHPIPPAIGPPVLLIEEANLILAAFPNDRKLRLLSKDEVDLWLTEHLHELLNGELDGARWRLKETEVEVLRYVPDRRLTARVRARLGLEDGSEKAVAFIAKQFYKPKRAKDYCRNLHKLQTARAEFDSPHGTLRLPRKLALVEKRAAVLIEELPGKNLEQALPELDVKNVMRLVGKMLVDFHRTPMRVRKKVTPGSEIDEVRKASRTIVQAIPHLRPRLRAIMESLLAWRWQSTASGALLHGSFRLNHILFHQGELAFLDLDSLRVGHPAYDLANFITSLYYLQAQDRITPPQRKNIAGYFLEGYAANSSRRISTPAVLWFFVTLLINKQALKHVTHLHENREEKVENMLRLAEEILFKPRPASLTDLWKALP
jgi:aminoglycoside phosphotransferase (APT) family kinase protein